MIPTITPRELKDQLGKGEKVLLLDVREPWEYALAKLEGSQLIPLGTLPQSLGKLDRNAEIVAYCHHGMRSLDAVSFLRSQGFSNARSLAGGIEAWALQVDPSTPRY